MKFRVGDRVRGKSYDGVEFSNAKVSWFDSEAGDYEVLDGDVYRWASAMSLELVVE